MTTQAALIPHAPKDLERLAEQVVATHAEMVNTRGAAKEAADAAKEAKAAHAEAVAKWVRARQTSGTAHAVADALADALGKDA